MTAESKDTGVNQIKVAKVLDSFTLVINKGQTDGVKEGQRFLVYAYGEEIVDPDTKTSLGRLEIVRGTGRVTHLQPTMATIKSDMNTPPSRSIRKIRHGSVYAIILDKAEEVEEIVPGDAAPFERPGVGDVAKPI
jgi:hypothetical protein